LVAALGSQYIALEQELGDLCALALNYGNDQSGVATVTCKARGFVSSCMYWGNLRNSEPCSSKHTALEPVLEIIPSSLSFFGNSFPLYHHISRYGLKDDLFSRYGDATPKFQYGNFSGPSYKSLLQKVPELMDGKLLDFYRLEDSLTRRIDFHLSDIQISVLNKSKEQLLKIIKYNKIWEFSDERFHPLVLAVGWPEGVELLLDAGYWTSLALSTAIYGENITCVKLMTKSRFNIFEENYTVVWAGNVKDKRVRQTIIEAFQDRRKKLEKFAKTRLNPEELENIGFSNDGDRDPDPGNICQHLIGCQIKIPDGLLFERYCYQTARGISEAEIFWDCGIRDLDGDSVQSSTLIMACRYWKAEYLRWCLVHGANPCLSFREAYPNLLFYVDSIVPRLLQKMNCYHLLINRHQLPSEWPPAPTSVDLLQYLAPCDPLDTDLCLCHCSSNGCLPIRGFWNCDEFSWSHNIWLCSTRTVDLWKVYVPLFMVLFRSLDNHQIEIYYQESCRIELFDRLGMKHTCCRRDSEGRRREICSNEEREIIEDEDSELSSQLILLLDAYKCARISRAGDLGEFWDWWWPKVEEILPARSPKERCKERLSDDVYFDRQKAEYELVEERVNREREVLRKSGYEGIDFTEVVRIHFREYLAP
jgi:hypothetical protein